MTHFDQCAARVRVHARGLIEAIESGRCNRSAYEGLMDSFIDQPAFSSCRDAMRTIARGEFSRI